MTTTSRIPQVLAALVTAFQNAPALGGATPPVAVYDGPKVNADAGPLALWVGVHDIESDSPVAANNEQQWMPGTGRTNRTEQIAIQCTAQAWSGGDDVATLRAQVAAILAAVQDVLRADPSLGGALTGTRDAGVTSGEWRQGPTTRGMAVRVMFTISATSIIGTP